MNSILRKTCFFAGAVMLLPGCIEETFPEGGYATADQIAESSMALEGMISSIPTIMITNYLDLGEHVDFGYPGILGANDRLAGDVFPVAQNLPGGNQYYDRWQPWLYPCASNALNASMGWSSMHYLNYYQFIKAANDVLATVGNDEDTKESRGIAKAFRALFYLDLVRHYDPLPANAPLLTGYESQRAAVEGLTVPLVTEASEVDQLRNNPRMTREQAFEFIFSDLDDAEACLADYTPARKNMPSLAVVYGLKARAYLWLGGFDNLNYANVPTGVEAYRLAAEYARKAIDASGCTIMTSAQWLDPATGFNTVNAAWMWAMIQSTDTVLNNLLSWSAHMSLDAMYGYGYLAQPGIPSNLYARISANDFRRLSFVNPDRDWSAFEPYTNLTEDEFETVAAYASTKFHTAGGEKSDYSTANVTSIPLMRVEEMYLIEAEATAHYDEGTGRTLLENFMSNRAPGYTVPAASSSGDALIDEIIFQKRIELWGEGLILFDMKRLNMSIQNASNNAPSGAKLDTDGRAPWWNQTIPISVAQRNTILLTTNNPDPCMSYNVQ
ncbi:MAG: RagB/SusD family nutrient uptake outer membrane protein [Bacteroidetes bacterium]|uniref:RagB/SusD family nutrient uptake outer membrane protein n=1 Tax=Candidatus Cryptobacteroides merdavium TaxID=2840769 RepID=A0A9D9EBN1_9BACT|nr:RagB/SusD family nutrient uptake outer membrane protein [Candidatus Cryptobacteroides merdavium]